MEKKLKVALILVMVGTPFLFVPLVISYIFKFTRLEKLLVFVLFTITALTFGNIEYLAFILLFAVAILPTSRKAEYVFLTLSLVFLVFQPVNPFTYQLVILAIGAVMLAAIIIPEAMPFLFHRHRHTSKEEMEKEIYRKLIWK